MSVDEDTELRDVVLETLDQRGVVGKTKAMLRANIFTALEETAPPHDKIYMLNKRLKDSLATEEGTLMAGLIVDYFTCLQLEFSKTVFEPETGFDTTSSTREGLCNCLGIALPVDKDQPLLSQLVSRQKAGDADNSLSRRHLSGHSSQWQHTIPQDLTPKQIADAKAKFSLYDKDNNDTIDKDELRNLFLDMFPDFHRNMLERYVTDEFRAADKDFSAGIDIEEFIDLYRRLFISCKSVVSCDVNDIITTTPRSPSPRLSKIPIKSDSHGSGGKKDSLTSPRHIQGCKIPQLTTGVSPPADSLKSPTDTSRSGSFSGSTIPSNTNNSNLQVKQTKDSAAKSNTSLKSIDKSLADLGFDVPEDETESVRTRSDGYEDDFERSHGSSHSFLKSASESVRTADSLSTEDITDKVGDDEEDIDALLRDNDISWGNDTEDKSVTDDGSVKGVDYWEVVPKK